MADRLGLRHYLTGASKLNPVEYHLFPPITIHWAGKPLSTLELMLSNIRGDVTETGLKVKAYLVEQVYEKCIKVANEIIQIIDIQPQTTCPRWNYTIRSLVVVYEKGFQSSELFFCTSLVARKP